MIEESAALRAATEMLLPGDFAMRVLREARGHRKRRKRNRVASAVACGALLIGLTLALGRSSRAPAGVNAADSYVLQTQWDANLEQLARATAPDQPGDYLTPAAAWSASESDSSASASGELDWQG